MKINYALANVLITEENVKLYCREKLSELCCYLPKGQSLARKVKARLKPLCELQDFLMLQDEHNRAKKSQTIQAHKPIPSRDLLGRLAIINQGTNKAYVLPKSQRFNTHSAYTTFSHKELNQLQVHQRELIEQSLREDDLLRLEALTDKELRFFEVIELEEAE